MQLGVVLLLGATAVLLRLFGRTRAGRWLVLLASGLSVYALQPSLPVRGLDFWLPTLTLALTALGWVLTSRAPQTSTRTDVAAAAALLGIALAAALSRYLGAGDWLLPTRPPALLRIVPGLLLLAGCGLLLHRLRPAARNRWIAAAIAMLIVVLLILKTPALAWLASAGLRTLAGQNPTLASALDFRWLGFSYIVFRLIHTLRDRQSGRLPDVDLLTYVCYVIFFPALVAGPIDRIERFAADFPAGSVPHDPAPVVANLAEDLLQGSRRFGIGLVKKFVIADLLALAALTPVNALQVRSAAWLWLLLYLYALQIYFDFSGYTDIAIGMGRVLGVKLPENFAAPYRKPNLTQFWNSWHISLTQWFRAYCFNPLTRWLRKHGKALPAAVQVLVPQLALMLLIGVWHGVTWNFALWGLWHGVGLFVQNRWTGATRRWFAEHPFSPLAGRAAQGFSTLLTFHYVVLGWVWFVIPDPATAATVLRRVLGGGW